MAKIDKRQWNSLTEMLAHYAEQAGSRVFTRFWSKDAVVETLTYAQAYDWAQRWAAMLAAHGVGRDTVVIMALPNTADFVGAYFGALLLRAIPAPAAPFRRINAGDAYLETIANRVRFVDAPVLVMPADQRSIKETPPFQSLPGRVVVTCEDVPDQAPYRPVTSEPDDLGLMQFTSGTSGQAKGVELTHAALVAQTLMVADGLELTDNDLDWAVSWLPLYHDMGLIGFLLTVAVVGGTVNLLPTEDFVMRPNLWPMLLSETRATITGGPPSALMITARRAKASEIEALDLSNLRVLLVGAETVTPESIERFFETYAPAGLKRQAMMPTYGMAENSLAVSMPTPAELPHFDWVDLQALVDGKAVPSRNGEGRAVAGLGWPLDGITIRIVDEAGQPLGEREVGEIAVRSPSLMRGYYRLPERTADALRDGWLFTGDMGYMADGQLYMTARKKEVLIVGGRNYYPDDLEAVAGEVKGVRMNRTVAFSVFDDERATEAVVVVAETGLNDPDARDGLKRDIRKALIAAGYPISEVVLTPPKTIQSTQNGKLKRLDCKQRYLAGELAA